MKPARCLSALALGAMALGGAGLVVRLAGEFRGETWESACDCACAAESLFAGVDPAVVCAVVFFGGALLFLLRFGLEGDA